MALNQIRVWISFSGCLELENREYNLILSTTQYVSVLIPLISMRVPMTLFVALKFQKT
ncbi:hypothetical protein Syun_029969 [Stephania yunnanensis]|uniref:Uncharacterized protein n=1 Tax=Stephania yunnanensis TaxID=152371 RepID=A0AAP0E8Y1_9MAGN